MQGPEKSADEKAEETRKQAEAIGKVTLETSKSLMAWIFGFWAKLGLGCFILVIAVFVGGCLVITQLL